MSFLSIVYNKGSYRATAIAYMKREKVDVVENTNGEFYTLQQLETIAIR